MGSRAHFWVSNIKTGLRMCGYSVILFGGGKALSVPVGLGILFLAEVMGVVEEIVDRR